jgi:hypothetical protein
MFENRVLRRKFWPKRDEVTGKWRKLQNEEINSLYSSPNIIRVVKSRRMRWAGHVVYTGERKAVYRVLVRNCEGKILLGRHRRIWEYNFEMVLKEVGCGVMDWLDLALDRDRSRSLVNAVMNLWFP